jgi:hypothetical protein
MLTRQRDVASASSIVQHLERETAALPIASSNLIKTMFFSLGVYQTDTWT